VRQTTSEDGRQEQRTPLLDVNTKFLPMPRKKSGRTGVTPPSAEQRQRASEANDDGRALRAQHQASDRMSPPALLRPPPAQDQTWYADQPLAPTGTSSVNRWRTFATKTLLRVFPLTLNMNTPNDPVTLQTLMDAKPYLDADEDLGDLMAQLYPSMEKSTTQIFTRLRDRPPDYTESRRCPPATRAEWVHACRAAAQMLATLSERLRRGGVTDAVELSTASSVSRLDWHTLALFRTLITGAGSAPAAREALRRIPESMRRYPMTPATMLRIASAAANDGKLMHHSSESHTKWGTMVEGVYDQLYLEIFMTVPPPTYTPSAHLLHLSHDVMEMSMDVAYCAAIRNLSMEVGNRALHLRGVGRNASPWEALLLAMQCQPESSRAVFLSTKQRLEQI